MNKEKGWYIGTVGVSILSIVLLNAYIRSVLKAELEGMEDRVGAQLMTIEADLDTNAAMVETLQAGLSTRAARVETVIWQATPAP